MSKIDFFPSLPLRDIVVFPGMIVPLFVGRDKSIKALNEVMKNNKKIILISQKNAEIDDPNFKDLYSLGCESKVLQLLKLPDGTVKVLVEGVDRVKIIECKNDDKDEYLISSIEVVKDKIESKSDSLAFSMAIVRKLEKLTNLNKKISFELDGENVVAYQQLSTEKEKFNSLYPNPYRQFLVLPVPKKGRTHNQTRLLFCRT